MTALPNALASTLRAFFGDHLPTIRGASPHTIRSYRDSVALLLRFLACTTKRPVATLDVSDLTVEHILGFLQHLEQQRRVTATTRNVRLAAIHAFARFLAAREPTHLDQAQRLLGIPFKRARPRPIAYLEYDEIAAVLASVDRSTRAGRRDYALLATMFNTGARVQEILDVRARDLQLTKPYQLRLVGKG
jgi:site-specific recombinase XerD